MQINEIYFAGFVGADAKSFDTKSGGKIVSINVCHTQKGKNGANDTSTWVRVKATGGWSELASGIKRGDNVIVKGPVGISEYTNKEGVKKTSIEIFAYSLAVIRKEARKEETTSEEVSEDIPF